MKSIIMIAYFFPPEGSAGSYRPLRFVRGLSRSGWETSVITARPYDYARYDHDLLGNVPRTTEVIHVRAQCDPWQAMQAWRGRRTRKLLSGAAAEVVDRVHATQCSPFRSAIRRTIQAATAYYYQPDAARRWIRPAVDATVSLCARKRPNIIWASAGPLSSWIVAWRSSQRANVPYVLDLRDPHGLINYEPDINLPQWIKRRLRRTMCQLFRHAQSVIFLFDTVAESYYRAFPGTLDPSKIHIIPNGYDGHVGDFLPPQKGQFTVLYTGTLRSYRYDTLLEAVALFRRTDAGKAKSLRFLFVGEGADILEKEAASLGLSDTVKGMSSTSYAEVTRLEQEAHALLVLGRLSTIKGHELFAGAKIFAYLKARRPILGVLPRDETRRILEQVGVSTVADVNSPSEIALILRRLMDAWSEGKLASFLPDRGQCELYSAERQVEDLIRALEGSLPVKPFVPGSVEVPNSLREEMKEHLQLGARAYS